MERDEFVEKWSRLYTMAKLSEAQIKANPLPHLQRMTRQGCEMQEAIEEALFIMSGADCLTIAQEEYSEIPPSAADTSLARQRRAGKVLSDALEAIKKEPSDAG